MDTLLSCLCDVTVWVAANAGLFFRREMYDFCQLSMPITVPGAAASRDLRGASLWWDAPYHTPPPLARWLASRWGVSGAGPARESRRPSPARAVCGEARPQRTAPRMGCVPYLGGPRGGSDRAPFAGRHPFGLDGAAVSGMGAAGLCLALA